MEQAKQISVSEHETLAISGLWRNKRFLILWAAAIFSSFAFSIYLITETWYVINGLNLDSKLGLVLMMTTIPRVLLMVVGGVAADRISRSVIMSVSNLLRGLLVLSLAFLVFNGLGKIEVIFVYALVFGILDSFFWPASNSLMPTLVEKQQLVRANSLMQTTNYLSFMIGPVLAGALIKFGSFETSFGTAGIMIFLSGIFILFMKDKKKTNEMPIKQFNFFQDLKEGISYVKTMPYILTSMVTSIIVNFLLVGPLNAGLPLLVEGKMNGDVLDLSLIESALAIGMLGGGLLTALLNIKKKRSIISISLIGIMGIFNGVLSQLTFLPLAMAVVLMTGICLAVSNIISPSLTQEIVEPKMMGRVQSLMSTASMGFTPLSYAGVAALLSFNVDISLIMVIASCLMTLFLAIVLWKVKVVWTID